MTRRITLRAWDNRLLQKLRSEHWGVTELQWLLTHLDKRTPTSVLQEIHGKLIEVNRPEGTRGTTVTPRRTNRNDGQSTVVCE
jgi:hypothetical protein